MRGAHYLKCYALYYNSLYNRFVARQNQRVTEAIMERISNESGVYDPKVIKSKKKLVIADCSISSIIGAIHRYYESRRRIVIEDLPERQDKSNYQKKKRKYRARQQRVCCWYYLAV